MTGKRRQPPRATSRYADSLDPMVDAVFRSEAARLTRYFRKRARGTDDPVDLVQESFLRLVGRLRSGTVGNPAGYVHSIARNLLFERSRRQAAKGAPPDHDLAPDVEIVVEPIQQQALIDRAGATNFINYTGRAYDPGNVVAIVNDYYTNAAEQRVSGIDVNASYRTDIGQSKVTLIGQASRIESQQKNSNAAAYYDLAGTAFNPPTFRSRVGFTLERGAFTFSPFVNYLAGIRDTRLTPARRGSSMATIDMTLLYDFAAQSGVLRNVGLALIIRNAINERPPYLRNTSTAVVNYDSTNYSAIGRFVSLSIRKRW